MLHLLNSAVMPTEGIYTLEQISPDTFRKDLQHAAATDDLRSYIGYPDTARLIAELTGVQVAVSREEARLNEGDVMLIMKLRYRTPNPTPQTPLQHTVDDFIFYRCTWHRLTEGERSG